MKLKKGDSLPSPRGGLIGYPQERRSRQRAYALYRQQYLATTPVGADMLSTTEALTSVSVDPYRLHALSPQTGLNLGVANVRMLLSREH